MKADDDATASQYYSIMLQNPKLPRSSTWLLRWVCDTAYSDCRQIGKSVRRIARNKIDRTIHYV